MRVHPSQLVTGALITKDVMGRTKNPIIPKNTLVHPIHIQVLKKFLIESVEVANKLSDGSPFVPEEPVDEEPIETKPYGSMESSENLTFHDQYVHAVHSYKKWFSDWRAGGSLDIKAIRKVIEPLLESAVQEKQEIFRLHHYSSSWDYLYHHSVAMSVMAAYLAYKMDYEYGEWIQVGLAGLLSDAGMARVDQRVIDKQAPLTEREFEQIKHHPAHSYRLVENIQALSRPAKLAILQHHERLDGTGYPLGLDHTKIQSYSQIIAVSDMYHAMTSERVYRQKHSPFQVLENILKEQFGRYDHTVIQVLVKGLTNYSTGTNIRLSNNRRAEIVFVDQTHPTRPMIRLEEDGEIYHLKEHMHLHIEEILE
ncbi:HD-GYP domain-containing protein [Halobacillus halophilus]|uniref:HD-GYP domain-containing protein n=1 Tax=Halobacillus halophilus TaxID=1570 RepID=UPI001CD4BEFB|nr:HD-GYP domain-containing protein [Halobacillus halophilus]MCA1011853.1 HD-GYP domain-containing protein [Halobacillus halophilus]